MVARSGRAKLGSILAGLVFFFFLSIAPSAYAQGCSMCASSSSAVGQKGRRTMARAVGVLLLPPLGMMTGLLGVAFRYRNRQNQ